MDLDWKQKTQLYFRTEITESLWVSNSNFFFHIAFDAFSILIRGFHPEILEFLLEKVSFRFWFPWRSISRSEEMSRIIAL